MSRSGSWTEIEPGESPDHVSLESARNVAVPVPLEEAGKTTREEMDEVYALLRPEDRRVLVLRLGLEGGNPRTLKEVAEIIGCSTRTVGCREKRALDVIRHPG